MARRSASALTERGALQKSIMLNFTTAWLAFPRLPGPTPDTMTRLLLLIAFPLAAYGDLRVNQTLLGRHTFGVEEYKNGTLKIASAHD